MHKIVRVSVKDNVKSNVDKCKGEAIDGHTPANKAASNAPASHPQNEKTSSQPQKEEILAVE